MPSLSNQTPAQCKCTPFISASELRSPKAGSCNSPYRVARIAAFHHNAGTYSPDTPHRLHGELPSPPAVHAPRVSSPLTPPLVRMVASRGRLLLACTRGSTLMASTAECASIRLSTLCDWILSNNDVKGLGQPLRSCCGSGTRSWCDVDRCKRERAVMPK